MVANINKISLPRHGYINNLAKLCNCTRQTVSRALFEGAKGSKADLVRKKYVSEYGKRSKRNNA